MMTTNQPIAIAKNRIHPDTKPAYIHLNVANIEQQIIFYKQALRLQLNWQIGSSAGLGIGKIDLVKITQVEKAKRYQGVTGMYHFAILYPSRGELAQAVSKLLNLGWPNSPTDHVMTKSIYLNDPEGNMIELYCESPEDGVFLIKDGELYARHSDGTISNGREPLDLKKSLFAYLKSTKTPDQTISLQTRMGHFHLYVANLEATRHFYHEILGFDDMGIAESFQMGMVSAGGYHHHIGYNTWLGQNAPSMPPDTLGLRHFAFKLPNNNELKKLHTRLLSQKISVKNSESGLILHDPSDNIIVFTTN